MRLSMRRATGEEMTKLERRLIDAVMARFEELFRSDREAVTRALKSDGSSLAKAMLRAAAALAKERSK